MYHVVASSPYSSSEVFHIAVFEDFSAASAFIKSVSSSDFSFSSGDDDMLCLPLRDYLVLDDGGLCELGC